MKNRAKINYAVDIMIGLGFIAAAISGIVLLLAGSGGYQGGRNPAVSQSIMFLSRLEWKDIHNWSGIIMVIGTLGHLVLHWNWFVCTTKNLFSKKSNSKTAAECAQ
ncbi:MAG: DUF4405 domain-containing protein [Spirochaetales bacterium]|nr:DUF4405 domain-containing protein [Spirochaetales bacterium]